MTGPPQYTSRSAGIDIGTLTCRLLIADLNPGQPLKELRSDRRILRLGEGVDQTKQLSSAAMDRTIACLQEWQNVIKGYHVEATVVVATSAVRDAGNREEFLERVKREAGFEVEVISGDEEARRTLLGIRSGLPAGVTDILALDIGGGSTEFILDRLGQEPLVRSIDIGVVRLCERLLRHDPPTDEEVRQACEWVKQETKTAVAGMRNYQQATFVGTAGTITSLAAMAQKLPTYEPARIHNYVLKLETIRELEHQLLSRTKAERIGLPGLEKNREEVIAAGAIIVRTIMETLEREECLVSDLGLREGVLIDLGKRMDNARLIQAWAIAGVKDFYISFEFEAENKWHEYSTFFCHQGLEKICKAYILARSASTWAHLSDDKAVAQAANKIAKKLGHNLKRLIDCLRSRGVLPTPSPRQGSSSGAGHRRGSYSEDELIKILEAAYIEARYPTPKSEQIHRQYPTPKSKQRDQQYPLSKRYQMFSDPIGETVPIEYARKTASAVLKKIESDFSITIPRDKRYVSSRISEESWRRFETVFFR